MRRETSERGRDDGWTDGRTDGRTTTRAHSFFDIFFAFYGFWSSFFGGISCDSGRGALLGSNKHWKKCGGGRGGWGGVGWGRNVSKVGERLCLFVLGGCLSSLHPSSSSSPLWMLGLLHARGWDPLLLLLPPLRNFQRMHHLCIASHRPLTRPLSHASSPKLQSLPPSHPPPAPDQPTPPDKWQQAYRFLGAYIDCHNTWGGGGHSHDNNNNNENDGESGCSRWAMWAAVSGFGCGCWSLVVFVVSSVGEGGGGGRANDAMCAERLSLPFACLVHV